MSHKTNFTSQKISRRLELIEPLVYRRSQPLPPFRVLYMTSPLADPATGFDMGPDFMAPVDRPLANRP